MKNSVKNFKKMEEIAIGFIDQAIEEHISDIRLRLKAKFKYQNGKKIVYYDEERMITKNLLKILWANIDFRNQFIFKPVYDFSTAEEDEIGFDVDLLGILDFIIYLDEEQEEFLGFEAKRLNIQKNGIITNDIEYVENGVNDFVSEKYSSGLPIGCMLGYVLNGDFTDLQKKIVNRIKSNTDSHLVKDRIPIGRIRQTERFATEHERNDTGKIIIRHTLLDCSLSRNSKK